MSYTLGFDRAILSTHETVKGCKISAAADVWHRTVCGKQYTIADTSGKLIAFADFLNGKLIWQTPRNGGAS